MKDENWSLIKKPLNRSGHPSIQYGSFSSHFAVLDGREQKLLKWEMSHGIVSQPCPQCKGQTHLFGELKWLDGIEIIYVTYKCSDCLSTFTTTEIDMINFIPLTVKRKRRKLIIKTVIELLKLKPKQTCQKS